MPLDLVTPQQLCSQLKISKSTLWRRRKDPKFPAPYRIGRLVRFSLAEVARHFSPQN